MKTDVIYARDRNTRCEMIWFEISGYGTKWSSFNFSDFEFYINGVIYTTDSPAWQEKIKELQMWEQLST